VNWIHLAQNTDQWQAFVKMVLTLPIHTSRRISSPFLQLYASDEGFCTELVSYSCMYPLICVYIHTHVLPYVSLSGKSGQLFMGMKQEMRNKKCGQMHPSGSKNRLRLHCVRAELYGRARVGRWVTLSMAHVQLLFLLIRLLFYKSVIFMHILYKK
jgi:hypothetical protein